MFKYITSVEDSDKNIKHIISIKEKNVEVLFMKEGTGYGSKSDEGYYMYNNFRIFKDFTFRSNSGYDSDHLANLVIAIEVARFIEELK